MSFKPKRKVSEEAEFEKKGSVQDPAEQGGVRHYLDGDMLSFMIAAACETKKVIITHTPTGNKKEFKNKTEFQGRSRKTIGGWLGDLNKSREEKQQATFSLEEFTMEDVYEASPIENALYSVKHKLKSIETHLGVGGTKIVMGEGLNFRHHLPLPTRYKAERVGMHKPILLNQVRKYLVDVKGAEVVTGIEADDRMAMYQFAGYKGFVETGKYSTITTCVDKDATQTNGKLFNPTTTPEGQFLYPDVLTINGLGQLHLNEKGAPKFYGRRAIYYQILAGDTSDCYSPTKHFFKGVGPKTVCDALEDCKTDKDHWEKIVEMYQGWFPTGVQYESWCGKEMDLSPVEWCQMIADCVFMQRWKDDRLDVKKVLDHLGITYD